MPNVFYSCGTFSHKGAQTFRELSVTFLRLFPDGLCGMAADVVLPGPVSSAGVPGWKLWVQGVWR